MARKPSNAGPPELTAILNSPLEKASKPAKAEPERATEGATFKLRHGYQGGTHTVGPKCDKNSGRWVCTTHGEVFDNQLQKDLHLDERGRHVLAWWCFHHGPEVP